MEFFENDTGITNGLGKRKTSDFLKEAQSTFNVLPFKEAEDLKDFLSRNSDNVKTYDINEENLNWLKNIGRYPSHFIFIWIANSSQRSSSRVTSKGDNDTVCL